MEKPLIIVRGGGDLATGTIYKLKKSGFRVLILEADRPSAIRRSVAFSEAVYQGTWQVEDMICHRADSLEAALELLRRDQLPLLVDPEGKSIELLRPEVVVDAIIAKKNLGTRKDMANLVIALGPGFVAGEDCHLVIETKRGHNLGRAIRSGSAIPNTGIPGEIRGVGIERVIHSAGEGSIHTLADIGAVVKKGQLLAEIHTKAGDVLPVTATIDGVLRGMIRNGFAVTEGFKIADIDPRESEIDNCYTISDKARCIAGGVLEVVDEHLRGPRRMRVIAVAGAGGKTTHIRTMAQNYRRAGKRVLISTTTHMSIEADAVLNQDVEAIRKKLAEDGVCVAGTQGTDRRGKPIMQGVDFDVIRFVAENFAPESGPDVLLLEADGSRHLPVKFPNSTEPVIPEGVDEIHVMMGRHALGHPFRDVAHRLERVCEALGVTPDDIVTEEHVLELYERGYRAPLQERFPQAEISFHWGFYVEPGQE